ncbi:helix-turn-helix domain-containing protein [Plantactinospora veratri]|uniref:Helix-turn-helix domain-containing protein n=1 Tax=Plantactinospora veratri TaxID=1436122 RepID=A0ABU7SJV5_9ACTN
MSPIPTDRILDAALGCFGRYGFRGTSVERIAEAAGVSRPTVYQRYKGKESIFRAVGARMLDAALADAEAAAGRDAPLPERLHGVLEAKFRLVVGAVDGEVRAEVLADAASVAGDLLQSFHQRLHAILTRLVADAGGLEPDRLPATDLALLLLDATTGIEQEDAPPEVLGVRLRQLVDLTVRALREPR